MALPPEIERLARLHHSQLLQLEGAALVAMRKRLDRVKKDLNDEWRRQKSGAPRDTFRAQQQRIALLLSRFAQNETTADLEAYLTKIGGYFSAAGAFDAFTETAAWAKHYGQELRPINLSAVAAIDAEFLVDKFPVSIATYGTVLASRMRRDIGDAILRRDSRESITDRVEAAINESFDAERWRAERIVRTELANAYNHAHHETLVKAQDLRVADIQKTAIVTWDPRTDPDSYPMDGQVRELDENFVDGDGREFLHPPGRPNDREKEVAYLPDEPPSEPDPEAFAGDDPKHLPEKFAGELGEAANANTARVDVPDSIAGPVGDKMDEARRLHAEGVTGRELGAGEIDEFFEKKAEEPPEERLFPPTVEAVEEVRTLGGSTGAKLVRDPVSGRQFVMKRGASEDHLYEEMIADKIYRAAGAKVPEFRAYTDASGKTVKLAEFVEGKSLKEFLRTATAKQKARTLRRLQDNFTEDALLGNWDVVGLDFDNILVDDKGWPWRIDNGGSLRFRAQGQLKGGAWNDYPTELWTLRDSRVNAQTAEVFGTGAGYDADTIAKHWRRYKQPSSPQYRRVLEAAREAADEFPSSLGDDFVNVLEQRMENLREMSRQVEVMRADQFETAYLVNTFSKHRMGIRAGGLVDRLPTELSTRVRPSMRGKTGDPRQPIFDTFDVRDENGLKWDHLRDGTLVRDFHLYVNNNGGSATIIEEWASAQAGNSWSNGAQAMKGLWATEIRPSSTYWWQSGQSYAETQLARKASTYGMSKVRESMGAQHAFTYELLNKVNFSTKNSATNTLTVLRTVDRGVVAGIHGMKQGDSKVYSRGCMESCSVWNAVYVHGDALCKFENVPIHRSFGVYFQSRDANGYNDMFFGDRENEVVLDLDGFEAEWIASGHPR